MVSTVWVITAIAVVALLFVMLYHFNRMVTLRNRCRESWSNVDTELKRRHELVPNLVATVEGYAKHERALIEQVTRARTEAVAPHGGAEEQAAAERPLVRALDRLIAVAEGYPELRASKGFLELQKELAITEDRIQAARRFYNANVRDYQDLTQSFPGLAFARLFGFGHIGFFEVQTLERATPAVTFRPSGEGAA